MRRFLPPLLGSTLLLGSMALGSASLAAEPAGKAKAEPSAEQQSPQIEEPPSLRRGGFMVGLAVAGHVGGASGYPNDVEKIDREPYHTNTGAGLGGGAALWFGWAIADWVTFGLGISGGAVSTGDELVRSAAAGLRVDLFPGWPLGGPWQDVGAFFETGFGYTTTELAGEDADPLIESGGASHLAVGVFYEGIRAWQFSMGPLATVDLVWSPSVLRPVGWVGWRVAYYAGP